MRSFVVASLAALVACCFAAVPHTLRFQIEPEKGRVGTFKFTNCMPPAQEMIVVNSLTVGPDPLTFPGPLQVAFNFTVKKTVESPLKAVLYLGRKIGSEFIRIPCIDNVGSCTYHDVCQLLSLIGQCPDPFVSAGVPCMCPFKTGGYKLPQTTFDIESPLLPSGEYSAQVNLTMHGQTVGCYDILATFS